jgi:hypothetical protein
MEASAAGLAAGDAAQGEGQEQQQGGAQPGAEQQPDVGALLGQLEGIPAQLEQMREFMEQQQLSQLQTGAEPAAGAEEQQVDLSFVDPESPQYDPQRAAQELLSVLQQQQATAVQEAVAPLNEQLQTMQTQREADALASEFPELENEETANAVLKATGEWVRAAGLPPEAAGNMQVVRAVFMMGRAAQLHNEESGSGQQPAAHLEGAGGASPGGGASGGITAESILNGGGRRSPLPFG